MLRLALIVFTLVAVARCEPQRPQVEDLIKQLFPEESSTNSTASSAESSVNRTRPSCKGGYACVPYALCRVDNSGDSASGCEDNLEVCCALNDTLEIDADPTIVKCGIRNVDGVGFVIQRDNDNLTQFGEFPWMVAIIEIERTDSYKYQVYQCGGSLIHLSVVITGAHCVESKRVEDLIVRAGEWDTQTESEIFHHQDRNVKNVIIHEDFHKAALFNDIALVFVSKPFVPLDSIQPICLPPPNQNFDMERCYATGWGKDRFGLQGSYQVILKKLLLPIVPHKTCQEELRDTRLGKFFILDESFICAGGEPEKDTCKGDGGSPLVCPIAGNENRYYQAGIVSWGIGCGGAIPAVYSNVAYLRPWIDKKLLAENINSSSYTP